MSRMPPIVEDGPRTVRDAAVGHDIARVYAAAYASCPSSFEALRLEAGRFAVRNFIGLLNEAVEL
jgi:hypothetical protein